MQLFFFGSLASEPSLQVLAEVGKFIPNENIEVFQTLTGLDKRLHDIHANPEILVFVPTDQQELMSLLSLQELFSSLPIILVLPDQHPTTVQYGHRLQPRFLTFSDSSLEEVGNVLQKIQDTHKNMRGNR